MHEENNLVQSNLKIFLLGSLISFSMGYGAYHYYQQYQRKKKQELREFQLAVDQFHSIIRTINHAIYENDLMIAYYQERFCQINDAIIKCLPDVKSNQVSTTQQESPDDWNALVRLYNIAVAEYPDTPNLVKMSPQSIHEQCSIFQEYHQKVSSLCEYISDKGAHDLREYEELMKRAQNLAVAKI